MCIKNRINLHNLLLCNPPPPPPLLPTLNIMHQSIFLDNQIYPGERKYPGEGESISFL